MSTTKALARVEKDTLDSADYRGRLMTATIDFSPHHWEIDWAEPDQLGDHLRFLARHMSSNGNEIVRSSQTYADKRAALHAISLATEAPIISEWLDNLITEPPHRRYVEVNGKRVVIRDLTVPVRPIGKGLVRNPHG